MPTESKHPRKNYFISKRLQGRYVCAIYLLVALVVVTFAVVFSMSTSESMTITYDNNNFQLGSTPFILFKKLLSAGWVLVIILGFLASVIALFQTHRIAGPLYKFGLILDQMSQGILDPGVNIRKSDDAQEIIVKLQTLNLFLVKKVTDLQGQVALLETQITPAASPEQVSAVQELKNILADFEIRQ